MRTFKIKVGGGRRAVEYTIAESSHHDTAANAVIEALQTYKRHGLSTFPYCDHVTVEVKRIEEDG